MITPAQAEQLIRQHLRSLPAESLPLAQCAGAVLREAIHAERDQPPFDRVAMDGIALDSATVRGGQRRFPIEGTQAAGDAPLRLKSPTACLEAMTGAMLPGGCDAVIPVERITVADGVATLTEGLTPPAPWQNVHRRGSDARQGALLLEPGCRLDVPEVAIAASQGLARVQVSAQPMLMVISTGNELVEPGDPVLPHQIRRSNVYAVSAALRRHGFNRVANDHLRDDPAPMQARLAQHLATHDVLVLSGGVSMGKFDLVPRILSALGVREVFHKIEQRPGKPLWFGVTDSGKAVFGLPGNPVSTLVCLGRYVLPALAAAQSAGASGPMLENQRIALTEAVKKSSRVALFLPVRVQHDDMGRAWGIPRLTNGSGDFTSLAGTQGFVELPVGVDECPREFTAPFYRW